MNGHAPRSSPSTIDPTSLSTQALWTVVHIAIPMRDGYSEREVAMMLGVQTRWVRGRLTVLRDELSSRSSEHEAMPDLSPPDQ